MKLSIHIPAPLFATSTRFRGAIRWKYFKLAIHISAGQVNTAGRRAKRAIRFENKTQIPLYIAYIFVIVHEQAVINNFWQKISNFFR